MMETRPGEHRHWLAETKSYRLYYVRTSPPRHLFDDLRNELASNPLTLLSTPAGYGKTTLLAAVPPAYPDLCPAQLSLAEEDNDPVRFLAALIAALYRPIPLSRHAGERVHAVERVRQHNRRRAEEYMDVPLQSLPAMSSGE
jgi:ATP/maltotriose-dependent transcriptional regulator MalT